MKTIDEIFNKHTFLWQLDEDDDEKEQLLDKNGFRNAALDLVADALTKVLGEIKIEQKGYFEASDEEQLHGIPIWEDNGSDRPTFIIVINKESITNVLNEYL